MAIVVPLSMAIVAPHSVMAPILTRSSPSLLTVPRSNHTKACLGKILCVTELSRNTVPTEMLGPLRSILLSTISTKGATPGARVRKETRSSLPCRVLGAFSHEAGIVAHVEIEVSVQHVTVEQRPTAASNGIAFVEAFP